MGHIQISNFLTLIEFLNVDIEILERFFNVSEEKFQKFSKFGNLNLIKFLRFYFF